MNGGLQPPEGRGEAGWETARARAGRVCVWAMWAHASHTSPCQVSLAGWLEEDKSHVGKDPVHKESHDSSAEQPRHGDSHEPGHEDVPEEVPVHGLPGADPAHSHHGAHLRAETVYS